MKHLAALVSAALLTTMLSLGFAPAAQATCTGYTCIDTQTFASAKKNPIRAKQRLPFTVRVRAENGRFPNAKLTVIVKRRGNGKVVWRGTRKYNQRLETYRTGKLPKGKFKLIVRSKVHNDRYSDSRDVVRFRVKKRR